MSKKAIFNWSGGKDSALCLHKVLKDNLFDIKHLLTTLNGKNQRVSMHGVAEELLDRQAKEIGLPLTKLFLPENPSMDEYNELMSSFLSQVKQEGIDISIFGDIFLEDLRAYRENQLDKLNMKAKFPLWGTKTKDVAKEFIDTGFKTIIVSVDSRVLDKSFAGRVFDESFLQDLPLNVDPCGENGEFHSFVFDGPIFRNPVSFRKGDVVYREYKTKNSESETFGFWYCNLEP